MALKAEILKNLIKAKLDDFNPDEPRDESGKWTQGGGGGGAKDKIVNPHNKEVVHGKGVRVAGGKVVTEPGHYKLDHDALVHHLYNGSWSTLTAANPMAKPLPKEENEARMKLLEGELVENGAIFHRVNGLYGGAPEPSLMVEHFGKIDAAFLDKLAEKWNQESTLHSEKGKSTIHFLAGENKGKDLTAKGFSLRPSKKDPQTAVPGAGKFTLTKFGDAADTATQGYGFDIELEDGSFAQVRLQ